MSDRFGPVILSFPHDKYKFRQQGMHARMSMCEFNRYRPRECSMCSVCSCVIEHGELSAVFMYHLRWRVSVKNLLECGSVPCIATFEEDKDAVMTLLTGVLCGDD